MRRACLTRIANPSLTLLAALKIGGFTFQQENPTCEDFDDDGVRLRQRKNQLCVSMVRWVRLFSPLSFFSVYDYACSVRANVLWPIKRALSITFRKPPKCVFCAVFSSHHRQS